MDHFLPKLGILAVGIFAVTIYIWRFSRSSALLSQWADANGLEILHKEYRHFSRGPFFWTSSKWQVVYYVEVRDSEGHIRTGWVRCGSFFLGLLSERVEAKWES